MEEARVHHAVEQIGLSGYLRLARRDGESALMFRLHPELRRRTVYAGVFWKRTHARLRWRSSESCSRGASPRHCS